MASSYKYFTKTKSFIIPQVHIPSSDFQSFLTVRSWWRRMQNYHHQEEEENGRLYASGWLAGSWWWRLSGARGERPTDWLARSTKSKEQRRYTTYGIFHCHLGPLHTRAKSRDHDIVRAQKKVSQRPSEHTSKIIWCGHGPSSVVWSHMWPNPSPNAISMSFHSCGSSHMIKPTKSMVVSVQSVPSSPRFCVRPTFKRRFWKILQVTMNHDPFGAM